MNISKIIPTSKLGRGVSAFVLAAGLLGAGAIAATAGVPGSTDCKTLSYPLCSKSVAGTQIVNGSVNQVEFDASTRAKLDDKTGQVTAVESDGPYPGSTKLQDHPGNGANSTAKVPADGKSYPVWVQCAEGKTALGGGFRLGADQGDAVASKIQVIASEPTQVVKDGDTYKLKYTPIEGDAAGSLEPNGWLVEVINNGTVDATVRPWVTCAKVAK